MSKFERIFEKVMEAQKKFETTHLHVSVDFTIDDLKDALIETNGIIAEKDQEIAELKSKLEDLQNTYKKSVEIKSQIWERCKKAEADASETQALLEERNKERKKAYYNEHKEHIRTLRAAVIKAGLNPDGANNHKFRHSFISNLIRSGINVRAVQQLARHESVDITLNTYSHLLQNDLADAVNAI